MIDKFLKLGNLSVHKIITMLMYIGILPIFVKSYSIGKAIYLTHTYTKMVSYMEGGQNWYTDRRVNNIYLGMLSGIIYFVIYIIIWKLICELLLVLFRYFESRNKNID